MIGNLGYGEMIIVVFLALLLFGAKRLPEIGSSLGKSIRMFKKSVKDIQEELPSQDELYNDDIETSKPSSSSKSSSSAGSKTYSQQDTSADKDQD